MRAKIKDAIAGAGIPAPENIVVDGQIHRFPTNGQPSDRAGYYCFWDHWNGFVAGFFGDWRAGIQRTWTSKPDKGLTEAERRQIQETREKAEAYRKRKAKQAKEKARRLWELAGEVKSHSYVAAKGISPNGIRQLKNLLLVPVIDLEGEMHGLQLISQNGTKRFLPGTQVKGHFFRIGEGEPFYLCEGYATGASIYEAIKAQSSVVITFNAGNLKPVAKAIRTAYPQAKIVICADNDRWTTGNPGLTKAKEAAKAVNGFLVVPEFKNTTTRPTDFNDLHTLEGLKAVKASLENAKAPEPDIEATLERLAALSPIAYDRVRGKEAERLGVRVPTLDKEVEARRPKRGSEQERGVIVEDLDPWPEAVDGAELLNEIKGVIQRHVVLSHSQAVTCSLWSVLTYCYDSFRVLPVLALTSPEKRCGKTTLLEVLAGMVKAALPASNITPAALFRVIEGYLPCLLIDEADTFVRDNEELRGILNSGHTKQSSFVIRVNSDSLEPERFSTWGPKLIALIGQLPDTLRDRSIEIRLQRKLPGEKVKKLSLDFTDEVEPLRRKCLRWAEENSELLKAVDIEVPDVGNDRATDNWEPLFAIAQVAGDEWPEFVRGAMMAIERIGEEETVKQELLGDIRDILHGRERISSKDLVESLVELEDRPWSEWRHGKPLTQNSLARLLKPFGIRPKKIRLGEKSIQGYERAEFEEVFGRYLPQAPPTQSGTMEQVNDFNRLSQNQSGTQRGDVPLSNSANLLKSQACSSVPVGTQGEGKEGQEQGSLWTGSLEI